MAHKDGYEEWTCGRCGSHKLVGHRYGPEMDGFKLNAQCVPCGYVQAPPAKGATADLAAFAGQHLNIELEPWQAKLLEVGADEFKARMANFETAVRRVQRQQARVWADAFYEIAKAIDASGICPHDYVTRIEWRYLDGDNASAKEER